MLYDITPSVTSGRQERMRAMRLPPESTMQRRRKKTPPKRMCSSGLPTESTASGTSGRSAQPKGEAIRETLPRTYTRAATIPKANSAQRPGRRLGSTSVASGELAATMWLSMATWRPRR